MRFVIAFALLYCCGAAEQSTSASPQDGRLPPPHIKDFIEQHIKHVKQQIKEEQLKAGTPKPQINEQQAHEDIRKFIKAHITQVLQHVSQQKRKKEINATLTSSTPTFGNQTIEKLQEDVKDIMKQTETHVPQVINQRIAYKNQLKDETPERVVGRETTILRPVKGDIDHMQNRVILKKIDQKNDEKLHAIAGHVPQVVVQHHLGGEKQDAPLVNGNIQAIVHHQIHQHVPQAEGEQKHEHDTQTVNKLTHQHVSQVEDQKPVTPANVQAAIQSVIEPKPQQLPHTMKQHVTEVPKKDDKNNSVAVPEHIQTILKQVHRHIPQVINQHVTNLQKQAVEGAGMLQNPVNQTHHRVSEVTEALPAEIHRKDDQRTLTAPSTTTDAVHLLSPPGQRPPSNIESIVQQMHQPIPQVINHNQNQIAQALNDIGTSDKSHQSES